MIEKENQNVFRFSLYQEDVLLGERMIDANQFNPFTRYSIDIRDILPKVISKIQRTLSKKSYRTCVDEKLDLYQFHMNLINTYPNKYKDDLRYNPISITHEFDGRIIKGVECKIGLYINDNPIVERTFYVDGFNPVARWSLDIADAIEEVTDTIFNTIKDSDVNNMWDDYDLINYMGMNIAQVRELPNWRRHQLLSRIHG
jgi:hypothetical protein